MPLSAADRLGPYEILGPLGAGGMGEVYRARDPRMGREVAIKISAERFSERFDKEVRAIASLNHANVCTLYDVGPNYLVMELIEGPTLAERIKHGAIPLEESLNTAKQIAQALEAAHEKGIVHRDLKPGNVKIKPDGTVKVLDFGLAKMGEALPGAAGLEASPTLSPTLTEVEATRAGMILGTAAYMSPEQAKGKPVDKRADIWAFGVVLYEMLTGKRLFEGDTASEILGAIFHKEPDWNALPASTPPGIRALLRRCLQKDAAKRCRDAADIRFQIEDVQSAPLPAVASTSVAQVAALAPRRWLLPSAVALLSVAIVAGGTAWSLRAPAAPPSMVQRLTVDLPPKTQLASNFMETVALSPDGSHVVYAAFGPQGLQLYLRKMDTLESVPLSDTEGAGSPFFSPDGQWIGFFTLQGALRKTSVNGGAVLTLGIAPNPLGAAWGPDDTIVFLPQSSGPLYQISASGSEPRKFSTLDAGETAHAWPQFLPGGKTILYTVLTASTNPDDYQIAAQRLGTSEHKILVRGGTYGRYVPTGHMVYYRAGTIMAVPFDPERLEIKGTPSPVIEGVMSSTGLGAAGQFSFSARGSLAYVPGALQSGAESLVWVDRHGAAQPLPAPPRIYRAPRVSPNGWQVAVGIGNDVWIYDIPRDALTRLTFEGNNAATSATWTPDGKRVVYPSNRAGPTNLFTKAADGSGSEERLTTSDHTQRAGTISPDGRFEVIEELSPKTGPDLWVLPLEGDRKPRVFLQTPFAETAPVFSPDGHWVAYISDESGRQEVYVRPFPGPGGKWQVSIDGGTEAVWPPKGNEIFYRTGSNKEKMMVVDVQTQSTFSAGKPHLLFEGIYTAGGTGARYSVSPDGQRFLMVKDLAQDQSALTKIDVVVNWFEELKQKVPVK